MTRIETSRYRNSDSTTFAWADSDQDHFDREFDLYRLAQALETHDHTSGRGYPVGNFGAGAYAPGSIPTNALVTNPVFIGPLYIASGGLQSTGTIGITSGNLTVTGGNITTTGTITAAGTISSTGGALVSQAGLTVNSGGATITGNVSITGTLSCGTSALASGPLTVTGAINATTSIGAGSSITAGTFISAGGQISNSAGGAVFTGNVSVNGGTLTVASTIQNAAGGMQINGSPISLNAGAGAVDLYGTNITFHGPVGVLGNLGHTGTIAPTSNGVVNLGDPGFQYQSMYAVHAVISNSAQVGGLLTCTAGLTVSGAFLNVNDITVHNSLGVEATAGFHMIQPATSNFYSVGNSGLKWSEVWAVNGTIQTSSRDVKAHLEDLDPDEALRVVQNTRLYEFEYLKEGQTARRRKAARRHRQVGFVAEEAHPLLLVADDGVNAQTTASIALAAIKALSAQIQALQAQVAELQGAHA